MAVRELTDANADGTRLGQAATELIGFWGAAPVARPSGATQAAIVDSTGGTASGTNTLVAISGTYTQSEIRNNMATLAQAITALRSALVSAGILKGSA